MKVKATCTKSASQPTQSCGVVVGSSINVLSKKKTPSLGKGKVIDLDLPGFQRIESVLTIFPVSRAAWYAGIAEGRYPAGVQLGKRSVAWSNASLKKLISEVSSQSSAGFDTS